MPKEKKQYKEDVESLVRSLKECVDKFADGLTFLTTASPSEVSQKFSEVARYAADTCSYLTLFSRKFGDELGKDLIKLDQNFSDSISEHKYSLFAVFNAAAAYIKGLYDLLEKSPKLLREVGDEVRKELDNVAGDMSERASGFENTSVRLRL